MLFQLKLADGSVVEWEGASGEDAARRYVDVHRDATVVATREHPWGVRVLGRRAHIIEGGRTLCGRSAPIEEDFDRLNELGHGPSQGERYGACTED